MIQAAATLLKNEGIRVRVVNVVGTSCKQLCTVTLPESIFLKDLMVLGEPGGHPHALGHDAFEALFGKDTPVVINFHGYPLHIKALLFSREHALSRRRFEILGYVRGIICIVTVIELTSWSRLKKERLPLHGVCCASIKVSWQFNNSPIT